MTQGDTRPPEETGPVPPPESVHEKAKRLNPDLTILEPRRGVRPGDVYARIIRPRLFRRTSSGHLVATPESEIPANALQRQLRTLKRLFIGRPLLTAEEPHQRLTKLKALAVFGSDPISSCAYATEAAMVVLMAAGNGALRLSFNTSVAIALLLSMVAFSYRGTVRAYPHGGGTYNVSRENLGVLPGLIAAAALLVDYILTVSVSIVAGTSAITSALIASGYGAQVDALSNSFPPFLNLTVVISLIFIGMLTLGNLRGIRESGTIFSLPTYGFIFGMVAMIGIGVFKAFTGTLQPAVSPPILQVAEPISLWLILRAFSAGSVAMSGVEAISNGVPAFKPPESRNAAATLTVMAILLSTFFLGVSFLSTRMGLVPGEETVISQIALSVFGNNAFYYVFQIATMGILVIAGNTAFADFPRLSSVLARDNYMPHQFMYRGDRLSFSTGIIALGTVASGLVILFRGDVEALIHLYAIGVFLAFSMSNTGMVVHWWRLKAKGWRMSMVISGMGAVLTSAILLIVVVTKFAFGGWIIVVLIPLIVLMFRAIHRHYDNVAEQLRIEPEQLPPQKISQLVIMPIDDVNYASLRAMAVARTLSSEIVVMHICTDHERADKIEAKLKKYAPDMKLVVIESPTRAFIHPLLAYVDAVHRQTPDAFVTIVLPEFITAHWWEKFLHNRTAMRLITAFEKHPNVTVTLVPYLLKK